LSQKKILHVIKNTNDRYAYETCLRQNEEKGAAISVLLLHDAVFTPPEGVESLYACRDDAEARGTKNAGRLVTYEEIVEMLLRADTVICW
jgi:sulfur relay protein TusB/DsrH